MHYLIKGATVANADEQKQISNHYGHKIITTVCYRIMQHIKVLSVKKVCSHLLTWDCLAQSVISSDKLLRHFV